MNILVVDDEPVQLETLKRGLRRIGHEVLVADNVKSALTQLEQNRRQIHIVLTDYLMVGENGIDLLKRIRERHGNIPVIIMTAYGEKSLIIEALHNQCNGFIEKPFTLDQLTVEIERASRNLIQNVSSDELASVIPKMVHQLNNPLMSIMASAQLAMMKKNDAGAIDKYMENIIEGIDEIKKLNNQISRMGRSYRHSRETFSPILAVSTTIKMFKHLMGLKNIACQFECDNLSDVKVVGNREDMEQAFKNVILNAIDAMDGYSDKCLTIEVFLDKDKNEVRLLFQDTGCGIGENLRGKIFDQYVTTKPHGTGLGLPVAREIIEKHHGSIELESRVGKGTRFIVALPVVDSR